MNMRTRGFRRVLLAVGAGMLISGGEPVSGQEPGRTTSLTNEERVTIIEGVSEALLNVYIYEDVAEEMADLVDRRLQAGAYDEITEPLEFSQVLTEDLRSVANDLHLSVRVRHTHQGDDGGVTEEDGHGGPEVQRRNNFAFKKLEILEGNVGYLELNGFEGGPAAGATAVAAMNFLANSDALIIDLRKNGGGGPSVIQMIFGYLLEGPTHVTGFYVRETDTHQQFWSPPYVPGPSLADVPVFVLVGPWTFSAAEAFAYSMQARGRGTIVGEVTPGGSHPVRPVPVVGTEIVVHVPFGRTVEPLTNSDWEGKGIQPDIPASAEDALDVAHMEALKVIRDGSGDPEWRRNVGRILARIEGIRNAPDPSEATLEDYLGRYEGVVSMEVTVRDGALFLDIRGRPFSPLRFLGDDRFAIEAALGEVRFLRDGAGLVTGLEATVEEGEPDVFERVGG